MFSQLHNSKSDAIKSINRDPPSRVKKTTNKKTVPGNPYKVHKPLRRFPRGYMISALRNKPTVMPIAI